MSATRKKFVVGELRPSQLLFTYGVGSIVDLPYISTMVMGLDDWEHPSTNKVGEERLLQAVRALLGPQVNWLLAPPAPPEAVGGAPNPFDESYLVGVPVAAFPRWMLCTHCRTLASLDSGLFQLKADQFRTDRTRYVHINCAKTGAPPPVVPARFLVACKYGHLDDFPWVRFVHGDIPCKPRLKLRELGVTGEVPDIQVLCEACNRQRRMSDAFGAEGMKNLPECSGRFPHLRMYDKETCHEQARAILLGASNSWFPLVLSTLAIPEAIDALGQLVEEHWHILEKTANLQNIEFLRQIGQLQRFSLYSDDFETNTYSPSAVRLPLFHSGVVHSSFQTPYNDVFHQQQPGRPPKVVQPRPQLVGLYPLTLFSTAIRAIMHMKRFRRFSSTCSKDVI
jgi:hypothetical protein